MKTEKEITEQQNLIKDNLIEHITGENQKGSGINISKLKITLNTLKWVLGEDVKLVNVVSKKKKA